LHERPCSCQDKEPANNTCIARVKKSAFPLKLLLRDREYVPRLRVLNECEEPECLLRSSLKGKRDILRGRRVQIYHTNFFQDPCHCDVRWGSSAVFSARHVRLLPTVGEGDVQHCFYAPEAPVREQFRPPGSIVLFGALVESGREKSFTI
jgi:hypothetical protein